MPPITICLLAYGDFPKLARQVIESVQRHCNRSQYRLVVGANAVCDETRNYLEEWRSAGDIDRLILSPENINKCPMMRRMFEEVATEFIWWFDDDSYIVSPDALEQWIAATRRSSERTMMWGELCRCKW